MSENQQNLIDALAPFSDLGTHPPGVAETQNGFVARFVRNGAETTLVVSDDGRVIERSDGFEKLHINFRALIASEHYADLGRWSASQVHLLREKVENETIPVTGNIADAGLSGDFVFLDNFLQDCISKTPAPRTLICVIDGPAGIGKTSLIRSLAFSRAKYYRTTQRPLILHVESRGRMLQNITDLMAFSLQTLRVAVTYDQIPALLRYGLVTLAVDGFDELGDPSGYELAWAQINELVQSARGSGTLIFAGRETFISKSRIASALNAIQMPPDRLESFTLSGIKPTVAKDWLKSKGWTAETIQSEVVQPLFERESYALRPFFLSELARPEVESEIANGRVSDLLPFLVQTMIDREASKFGRDVEAATSHSQRAAFLYRLLEEVARDLAENQSGSVQSETLVWLAEMVSSDLQLGSLTGILKNRSNVVTFLADDERRGYKKFAHEIIYNYFLSRSAVAAIKAGEIPKFIRRNILGIDFLEVFSDVCRGLSQSDNEILIRKCCDNIKEIGNLDRGRANLASLALSACSVSMPKETPVIRSVAIDEVYFTETVSEVHLIDVTIGQIVARSADLRNVHFTGECNITTFVVDDGTVPSLSAPLPAILSLPSRTVYNPGEVIQWVERQAMNFGIFEPISFGRVLEDLEPFSLLARVVRYKPFWLKDSEERSARRILDDPSWELLRRLLEKHDLLTVRFDVPASGPRAPFYHIRNRGALANFESPPEEVWPFLKELLLESLRLHQAEIGSS